MEQLQKMYITSQNLGEIVEIKNSVKNETKTAMHLYNICEQELKLVVWDCAISMFTNILMKIQMYFLTRCVILCVISPSSSWACKLER